MKRDHLISIIIPTYNSEQFITSCLGAINNQTYKQYEVIVVDQESIDNTAKIAKKFGAHVIKVPKPKFYSPPSASRNIGAKYARGAYLYHLDSDMQMHVGLLREIIDIFAENVKVGALIVHEDDETKGFFSNCKSLERQCYRGNDSIDSARVVRKEVFEKVKGYDESISSGEDFDIHERYKKITKIMYCKQTVVHDLTNLTFIKMIKKKYSYGKTAGAYFRKSTRTGGSIVKEQINSYIRNYRLLVKHPILTIGMIFLRGCEITAGGIGYIMKGNGGDKGFLGN
jgi:glycosyltransferase involved in cell wall biosynthesis